MESISAELFACFAGSDLNRWRQLVDCRVVHRDPRWGFGRVVDVLWQGMDDGLIPRGTIFVRVVYESGLSTRVNAKSFSEFFGSVEIVPDLARLIADCFGTDGRPVERECSRRLEAFDRRARELWDAERLKRAEELRRRAQAPAAGSEPPG